MELIDVKQKKKFIWDEMSKSVVSTEKKQESNCTRFTVRTLPFDIGRRSNYYNQKQSVIHSDARTTNDDLKTSNRKFSFSKKDLHCNTVNDMSDKGVIRGCRKRSPFTIASKEHHEPQKRFTSSNVFKSGDHFSAISHHSSLEEFFIRDVVYLDNDENLLEKKSPVAKVVDIVFDFSLKKKKPCFIPRRNVDVVTVEDAFNAAIYECWDKEKNLPPNVVNFLVSPKVNKLMRALLIYMEAFMETKDKLEDMKANVDYSRWEKERHTLSELRAFAGQQYAMILEHYIDKPRPVMNERFESLLCLAPVAIWIIFSRCLRHKVLISKEINRLFRTPSFDSSWVSTKYQAHPFLCHVLHGKKDNCKRYLLPPKNVQSPLIEEFLSKAHSSNPLLNFKDMRLKINDPRISHIKACYYFPEEDFQNIGITLGILGKSLRMYDYSLNLITTDDENESII